MPLDEDIRTADDSLALDRIHLQEYRNDVKAAYAPAQFKKEFALALIPKYFTTGTTTNPTEIARDAREDAERFKAALRECLRVFYELP